SLAGPLDVKWSFANELWVGIYNIHSETHVNRYSSQLALVRAYDGYSGPIGLAFDRDGNVYVASYNTGVVTRTAPDGTSTPFVTGLSGPHAIAFDARGSLYIVNNSNGTVVRTAASATACQ